MDFKLKNKNDITLHTKNKYCREDINIIIDRSLFEQDYSAEDGLITRTLTSYYNDRVTSIGDRAFRDYYILEEVDFPNAIEIGQVAFYECKSLIKTNFPKVTSIGQQAFVNCLKLEKLVLQSATIGQQCFRGCSALKYVYLKDFKGFSGNAQFADCTSLVAVVIDATDVISLTDANIFTRSSIVNGTGYIYVKDELVDQYKYATNWATYSTQIKGLSELPQEVKEELGL